MSAGAIESIFRFSLFFIGAAAVQHILMQKMYRALFVKLKNAGIIGGMFSRPAVIAHELVGHLIPAMLSGSRIIDVELREERGHVGVKYAKNLFGMISVTISAFGPAFFLPLLFIALYAYLNAYDISLYLTSGDLSNKIFGLISDVSRLDEIKDIIVLYAAVAIAPSAASSTGDIKMFISFVKNNKGLAIIWASVWLIVFYISYALGTHATDIGAAIIINSFAHYIFMYAISFAVLFAIVRGWEKHALMEGVAAMICFPAAVKFIFPSFEYPLIIGLLASDLVVLALKNKK